MDTSALSSDSDGTDVVGEQHGADVNNGTGAVGEQHGADVNNGTGVVGEQHGADVYLPLLADYCNTTSASNLTPS